MPRTSNSTRNSTQRLATVRGSNRSRPTRAEQVISLVVLLLFSFQIGRFYLTAPLELHECPAPAPVGSELLHGSHSHTHSPAQALAPPGSDRGYYFQHCKEYVYGVGLTPAPALDVPVVSSFPWALTASIVSIPEIPLPTQDHYSTPFHPPRHPA